MKEQLIKLLGLSAEATDEQIVEAVTALKKAKTPTLAAPTAADKRDKAIRAKIAQSGGALSYEQAAMAIDHQAEADAKKKGKAKD